MELRLLTYNIILIHITSFYKKKYTCGHNLSNNYCREQQSTHQHGDSRQGCNDHDSSYISRHIAPSAVFFGNPIYDAGYVMELDTLQYQTCRHLSKKYCEYCYCH